MAKKGSIVKAKKKAWDAFSMWVRLRDAIKTTGTKDRLICCTCGKTYPAFGKGCAQAGHYISSRKSQVLLHERLVHGQCFNCNIILKGNYHNYRDFMVATYGEKEVKEMENDRKKQLAYTIEELELIEKAYKEKYQQLLKVY